MQTQLSLCLVCCEWNKIFIPLLYEEIILIGNKMVSNLFRTIWRDQTNHRSLIRRIMVYDNLSTSGRTSLLAHLSNLVHLEIKRFDCLHFPLNFPRVRRLLSSPCTVEIHASLIHTHPISHLLRFIRRSSCNPSFCVRVSTRALSDSSAWPP